MKKKHQSDQDGHEQKPAAPGSASTSRDVFVFGRLENEVALPTIKRLLKLNERDPKLPINLYINSSGGNGYNADGIIAVMHSISAKVNTICLGHALSGACEILASGTGVRSAYEFATLMFHQTLWEAEGDITNLEIQAVQGRRFREAQIELLHRSSGQSKERLRKDIERDFYLSPKEALDYGLIDKIIVHTAIRHLSSGLNGKKTQVPPVRRATKPPAHHKKLK
jgi:ATP-dependent Clp protease protease subunit